MANDVYILAFVLCDRKCKLCQRFGGKSFAKKKEVKDDFNIGENYWFRICPVLQYKNNG